MLSRGIDPYYIQRFLPALVVHCGLVLCSAEFTDHNVIAGFVVLNAFCMLASLGVWRLIADELGLGIRGRCLSLLGIFVNYVFLKGSSFYPVLTDDTAFLIGLLQFLFYLKARTIALLLTSFLGAFIWPTAMPVGMILAIFPRQTEVESSSTELFAPGPPRRSRPRSRPAS